ncbi:hypothetical protein [Butyrivibrio proteoclasticus]|uniref:hypothetical protein n=1 Tax=Butyrivibrio proteoclasticus TaxID=43305 RepID=UPI00047B3D13|nr:hypothetical protein [Butyrivibrio proteoclasticus]
MNFKAKKALIEADKGTSCITKPLKNKIMTFLQTTKTPKEVPLSASITVEASLALPFFIFFFVNILAAFNIIKVQSDLEAALHQTGNEICIRAFDERFGANLVLGEEDMSYDEGLEGYATAGAFSVYAANNVRSYVGDSVNESCVKNGLNGLSFFSSRVLFRNDIVDIVVDYKVKPLISMIGFSEFPVQGRYYGHAWTGYDLSCETQAESGDDEIVYVTEHGEAYHKDINCRYLKIDIKSIEFNSLDTARNSDRHKYYPCEYCGENVAGGNVFVTDYGERYHTSVNCPGLKRKIYTIRLSEAAGYRACSGCAH